MPKRENTLTTELTIPANVTEVSLTLPDGLGFDDWECVGIQLGRMGRACQWWIGDWLNFGARAYGEKYTQAIEATGYDYQTLANFAWVAEKVGVSLRRETLPWSHHKEVAKLDPPGQRRWLEIAENQKLSVSSLRAAMRGAESKPTKVTCPTCGHRVDPNDFKRGV